MNITRLAAIIVISATGLLLFACSNGSPVASAVQSVDGFVGVDVELDGSASTDPEDEELTYAWTITTGPEGSTARISGLSHPRPIFKPDVPGTYTVRLNVNDGNQTSDPVDITVVVRPWLTDVTAELGLAGNLETQDYYDGSGPGAAWGDYDGDGDMDLYVTSDGPDILYRNDGDSFTDVAADAGLTTLCNSYGAAWADYDNDGDLDIYVVCRSADDHADLAHVATEANLLYRNNGDATFTNVAPEAGVAAVAHGAGAAWADYDSDGWLDLYVANWGVGEFQTMTATTEANLLYHNNRDGTFTDMAEAAGVTGRSGFFDMDRSLTTELSGLSFMGLWSDFDNDGDPDLLECSEQGAASLFQNLGDGTFSDVTEVAGMMLRGSCMGVDSGDYDRNGFLDIYWTNFRENYLWKADGQGRYIESAKDAGVADELVGWATEFIDFDNDGWLDIYVVNGVIGVPVEITGEGNGHGKSVVEPNALYRNNGDGTFSDVTSLAGFGHSGVGRGSAVADYDNDGDLDLYLVNADGPNVLYRNEIGSLNNWLKLRFVGEASNARGVGVRVRLDTGDWSQIAEVKSGSGYLSGNDPGVFFGLGDAGVAATIVVEWPSGDVQTLREISANQTLTVQEP
jgi:enediyne biosynthesis protein E4